MTSVAVLAPSPTLTVTIEVGDDLGPDIHYHPGGQGVWVAHMAALLGADVVLCAMVAGESGNVLQALMPAAGIEVRSVVGQGRSASYVHDRRTGTREVVVETHGPVWSRHEADDFFGVALAAGLNADITLLTGTQPATALGDGFYQRLASDLRLNGQTVIADLSGPPLKGALAGGIDVLKVSDEELVSDGYATSREPGAVLAGIRRLRDAGARDVLVSRAGDPAFALVDDAWYEIEGPRVDASDPAGAGDSMFAALGVAMSRDGHDGLLEALRLAVAAGALNATRRGLGTGRKDEIERVAAEVCVRELETAGGAGR
jgi:1-phosphofructokinase